MKLKVLVIDLELSRRTKRIAAFLAAPLLVVAGGAVAYANAPHTWNDGDTLNAADLNGNFSDLDKRVTTIEQDAAGVLPLAHGGTGSATQNFVDLTTDQRIGGVKTFAGTAIEDSGSVLAEGSLLNFAAQNGKTYIESSVAQSPGTPADLLFTDGSGQNAWMTIKAGGNVGIGTTSPNGKFEVSGFGRVVSSAYNFRSVAEFGGGAGSNNAIIFNTGAPAGATALRGLGIASASQDFFVGRFDSSGNAAPIVDLAVLSNGNVGIGTNTPAYALDVVGNVRASNITAPSDATLKTHVRTLEHALDDVSRLRGVRFDWKKDGTPSVGVIAQELEQVYPELVSTAPDHIKSVDYMKLSAVLIEASKELRRENVALQEASQKLETRLQRVEAQLAGRSVK